jgi:hypothetical protein
MCSHGKWIFAPGSDSLQRFVRRVGFDDGPVVARRHFCIGPRTIPDRAPGVKAKKRDKHTDARCGAPDVTPGVQRKIEEAARTLWRPKWRDELHSEAQRRTGRRPFSHSA